MRFNGHYFISFWITLSVALGLLVGGFFAPPIGKIDGSIISSVGVIFLWPALAFGYKALAEGKTARIKHNKTQIIIGDCDEEGEELNEDGEE